MQLNDIAGRLLQIEQQLMAYQKLHTDELAELWQTLNQCKREIATVMTELRIDACEPHPTLDPHREREELT